MAHATNVVNRPHLDPNRIAAGSGALALNAVLVLALLAPVARPIAERLAPEPDIVFVQPVKRLPVRPPLPLPIEPERPRRPAPADPAPRVQPDGPPAQTVVPDATGEPAAATTTGLDTRSEPGDIAPPVAATVGAGLQYIDAPPPPYPRTALQERRTGTVMLEVLVDTEGRPVDVRIVQSSGHRDLDQAARRQVLKRWRFRPANEDGRTVQALGLVPVEFHLDP